MKIAYVERAQNSARCILSAIWMLMIAGILVYRTLLYRALQILWLFACLLGCPGPSCSTWDLVCWLGIEPRLPALGAWSLSHRTTKGVPQILCFLQMKGLWQPCVLQVCMSHFPNSICSLHVFGSHFGNSCSIWNVLLLCMLWWFVTSDLWYCYCKKILTCWRLRWWLISFGNKVCLN